MNSSIRGSSDRVLDVLVGEHREVRGRLAELCGAFASHDCERAARLLRSVTTFVGPHFRYEEEALFPALVSFRGRDYIERFLAERDRAIAAIERLVVLTCCPPLDRGTANEAQQWVGVLLAHLFNCDALAAAAEGLPDETRCAILETRDHALHAQLGLIEWATWHRERPHAALS